MEKTGRTKKRKKGKLGKTQVTEGLVFILFYFLLDLGSCFGSSYMKGRGRKEGVDTMEEITRDN